VCGRERNREGQRKRYRQIACVYLSVCVCGVFFMCMLCSKACHLAPCKVLREKLDLNAVCVFVCMGE